MLKSAQMGKEIVVTVVNKIGVLADISKILADHGLNILAIAGYAAENNTAKIMVICDDNLRAGDALRKAGYNSNKESEVVIVSLENRTGAMKFVANKLASEGIDIKHIYGTTCPGECPARIVLSTSDNEKALVAFNK